jgi:hypothetical protein
MLTMVTFRFAPWLGPELTGLTSQPAGTSLRNAASDTLNAIPMRLSMLLPENFSCAKAGAASSTNKSDSVVRMVNSRGGCYGANGAARRRAPAPRLMMGDLLGC